MDHKDRQCLLPIIHKIGTFKGLTLDEARRLLKVCRFQSFGQSERIYTQGDASTEMLILLKGSLIVTGQTGAIIGEISPGATTGEMGVFTGQPRSASIATTQPCSCLVLRKGELDTLLSSDRNMHVKILQNVVAMLSDRLVETGRRAQRSDLPLPSYAQDAA